jgi:hypothetical protein
MAVDVRTGQRMLIEHGRIAMSSIRRLAAGMRLRMAGDTGPYCQPYDTWDKVYTFPGVLPTTRHLGWAPSRLRGEVNGDHLFAWARRF